MPETLSAESVQTCPILQRHPALAEALGRDTPETPATDEQLHRILNERGLAFVGGENPAAWSASLTAARQTGLPFVLSEIFPEELPRSASAEDARWLGQNGTFLPALPSSTGKPASAGRKPASLVIWDSRSEQGSVLGHALGDDASRLPYLRPAHFVASLARLADLTVLDLAAHASPEEAVARLRTGDRLFTVCLHPALEQRLAGTAHHHEAIWTPLLFSLASPFRYRALGQPIPHRRKPGQPRRQTVRSALTELFQATRPNTVNAVHLPEESHAMVADWYHQVLSGNDTGPAPIWSPETLSLWTAAASCEPRILRVDRCLPRARESMSEAPWLDSPLGWNTLLAALDPDRKLLADADRDALALEAAHRLVCQVPAGDWVSLYSDLARLHPRTLFHCREAIVYFYNDDPKRTGYFLHYVHGLGQSALRESMPDSRRAELLQSAQGLLDEEIASSRDSGRGPSTRAALPVLFGDLDEALARVRQAYAEDDSVHEGYTRVASHLRLTVDTFVEPLTETARSTLEQAIDLLQREVTEGHPTRNTLLQLLDSLCRLHRRDEIRTLLTNGLASWKCGPVERCRVISNSFVYGFPDLSREVLAETRESTVSDPVNQAALACIAAILDDDATAAAWSQRIDQVPWIKLTRFQWISTPALAAVLAHLDQPDLAETILATFLWSCPSQLQFARYRTEQARRELAQRPPLSFDPSSIIRLSAAIAENFERESGLSRPPSRFLPLHD